MNFIEAKEVEKVVAGLCVKANTFLRPDVLQSIKKAYQKEKNGSLSREMLGILIKNAEIAGKSGLAICQDTGMVAVFVEMGRNAAIKNGDLMKAVNKGVAKAYRDKYFRKSVVGDPVLRKNTGTNTPAVIHIGINEGSSIKISVMAKGFGSENKSRMVMLDPTAGVERIEDFCVETVKKAGPDACPPYILGIGIGGTQEECALLAKKALLRPITKPNRLKHIARLEREIMDKANALKIGVMGLRGASTVIGVNIETGPTHIAGLPVAVNVSCHALRSASAVIGK